ncbi:hypothetical protein [Desulfosporosinus orientis]|uniref:hypothetical protein n=1 Tax=Desulfosporosinus orientis TaxID=1563 RepID=UPI00031E6CB8|nr:hypothetical protein [Desulfosporosinus orientis]
MERQRYQKMAREDDEFARLIDDRLVEDGVYKGERLSDEAFRELIRQIYLLFCFYKKRTSKTQ